MDNLDNLLSSVLSDEGLMNQIKSIVNNNNGDTSSSLNDVISLISPKLHQNREENDIEISTEENKNNLSNNSGIDKSSKLSFMNSLSHSISKNSELLLALKPYLSKERSQMIDGVVKISKITDTLNLL